MNSYEVPKFNINDSVSKYIIKVENYKIKLLKEKYDIVINFLNEWIFKNYKSLTDFKNINEEILLKNKKHNHAIARKYSDIFENKFNIDLSVDAATDSDDITDKYIIFMLSKILNNLDNHLSITQFNDKIYYTIKKN